MNVDLPTPVSPNSNTLTSVTDGSGLWGGGDDADNCRFNDRCDVGDDGDGNGSSNFKYKSLL
jgi:hypothetical protein